MTDVPDATDEVLARGLMFFGLLFVVLIAVAFGAH
jgi:hypothetical protein